MNSKTSHEIRRAFLDFFASHQHRVCRSLPLVPPGDATLLFTNAGMVQFKDVFTGREKLDFRRAASSQKCVRAGGKHNDLENVGRTARHHTFFEMLGNFSFGDYFKREAIHYAWDFLTRVVGLPKDRLWVTVFGGDAAEKLPPDEEAARIWHEEIGVPAERILRFGKKDNFWSMGDTGPCGPCSEIHVHQGDHLPCSEPEGCQGLACECDRFLEVWNLVFMQFERAADGRLSALPAPSIDTGMGLERLCAVLQGKDSNYHTDLFQPLIEQAAEIARRPYGKSVKDDVSLRVIADHSRATAFLMADGVLPANEGRGYVLRRIMRRAIRHGHRLGITEPFLHRVCGKVIEMMQPVYPELGEGRELIMRATEQEESAFRRTLEGGLKKLRREMERLRQEGGQLISGELLFELQATDGFPPDLTAVIAAEQGLRVDEEGYRRAFARHQEISAGALGLEGKEEIWQRLREKLGPTDFIGYEHTRGEANLLALVSLPGAGERRSLESALAGDRVEALFSLTPCYGESGGQVGDTGEVEGPAGRARIVDAVRVLPDLIVHRLEVTHGRLAVGERISIRVDAERRWHIRRNHTATHLLQAALRKVLGAHVNQSGSQVAPDRFRFDFSHFAALSPRELLEVEGLVNRWIREDVPLEISFTDLEGARAAGATMLFGEKYAERVRMVRIGEVSLELCGGTHVERTGQIGMLLVLSEGSVKAGIRRLEALTGEGALRKIQEDRQLLRAACEALRCSPEELASRIEQMQRRQTQLERETENLKERLAAGSGGDPTSGVREIGGVKVLGLLAEGLKLSGLRNFADSLGKKIGGVALALAAEGGKLSGACVVPEVLTTRLDARKLLSAAFSASGGRAGGRVDFAQGGGGDPARATEAVEAFYREVERTLLVR